MLQVTEWAAAGFPWLHIVDLDGVICGCPANHKIVRNILKEVDIKVQLGGGIRNYSHVDKWFNEGVDRIILGTSAIEDFDFVRQVSKKYEEKISISIDSWEGKVEINGWAKGTNIEAVELVNRFKDIGVASIIYTDISRYGTNKGVNIDSIISFAQATPLPVIASGGIASIEDIRQVIKLKRFGLEGAIVGKIFHNQNIGYEKINVMLNEA